MKRAFPLLFALAAVVGAGVACGGNGSGDAPLGAGDLHYGQPLDVGKEMSLGTIRLFVEDGDQPVHVEGVKLVGVKGALELLGVRSRQIPKPGGNFLADFGYPPEKFDDTAPLSENNVVPASERRTESGTPLDGLMLVIGLRVTEPGVAAARGVEISYRVGDDNFTETYNQHVFICAPQSSFEGERGCPPPDAEDDFGDSTLE